MCALSVPWANPQATGPLIDLFRGVDETNGGSLRWVIGNALEGVGDDRYFDELVGLARDRHYGRDRQMIVLGLARSQRPEATDVLVELLNDSDVIGHAVSAVD